jgi:hypothetical protein
VERPTTDQLRVGRQDLGGSELLERSLRFIKEIAPSSSRSSNSWFSSHVPRGCPESGVGDVVGEGESDDGAGAADLKLEEAVAGLRNIRRGVVPFFGRGQRGILSRRAE